VDRHISGATLARLAGVSAAAVSALAGRGHLPRREDGLYDLEDPAILAYIERHGHQRRSAGGAKAPELPAESAPVGAPAENENRHALECRKLRAQTRLLELRRERELGELIPRVVVETVLGNLSQIDTEIAQGWPEANAPSLAASARDVASPAEAERILRDALRHALARANAEKKERILRFNASLARLNAPRQDVGA
jgi:hypothetical protein